MSILQQLRRRAHDLGVAGSDRLELAPLVAAIKQALVAAGRMPTVADLRAMARQLGMNRYGRLKKAELIHRVQVAEGYTACFGRIPDCGQDDCLFRPDCLP